MKYTFMCCFRFDHEDLAIDDKLFTLSSRPRKLVNKTV